MKIRAIDAIPLRISFRQVHRFGTTDRRQSHNVVIRITTDDGLVGYGEACPIQAFTTETQESIMRSIDECVRDLLMGETPLAYRPLIRSLEPHLVGCPFTLTAVDIALWDLAGKALGVPVSVLLGGRFRESVTVYGSVGWDDRETMARKAVEECQHGYRILKLYAGRGSLADDLARVGAVRAAVGPEIAFIVDVNGMWTVDDCLRALPTLKDFGVVLLEQPIAASDEAGQAEVVRADVIPIAADEAVFSPEDVCRISRLQTANVINLGLSKLGGLLRARECEVIANASGLGLTIGSVLELGIATTAGLHLAAAAQQLAYPSYLEGPLKYEQEISVPALRVHEGSVAVPEGPGLGIDIDTDLLHALDARR